MQKAPTQVQNDDEPKRPNAHHETEITFDNLDIGKGSIKDKKEKLYQFVKRLMGDENSWNKMQNVI